MVNEDVNERDSFWSRHDAFFVLGHRIADTPARQSVVTFSTFHLRRIPKR